MASALAGGRLGPVICKPVPPSWKRRRWNAHAEEGTEARAALHGLEAGAVAPVFHTRFPIAEFPICKTEVTALVDADSRLVPGLRMEPLPVLVPEYAADMLDTSPQRRVSGSFRAF